MPQTQRVVNFAASRRTRSSECDVKVLSCHHCPSKAKFFIGGVWNSRGPLVTAALAAQHFYIKILARCLEFHPTSPHVAPAKTPTRQNYEPTNLPFCTGTPPLAASETYQTRSEHRTRLFILASATKPGLWRRPRREVVRGRHRDGRSVAGNGAHSIEFFWSAPWQSPFARH